jgi:hypothetical protein
MAMMIDPLIFMAVIIVEALIVAVIMVLLMYTTSSTATTIMIAKLTSKKNLVRKIYPGSRLEKLYVPKKANQDDIFTIDPKTRKIDVLDGRMKTEFGSTMVDGIRIHTVMAGDMAPMGPEAAASATYMITAAREVKEGKAVYPQLAQIRENHKITDMITADMEHLPDKAKKYVVVSTTNKTKEQIKNDKDNASRALVDEVIQLRGAMAGHPYPVDYITAINAVLNPVVKGIVELIDIYIQKRQEDLQKNKEKMMQYGIIFCMIVGVTAFGIIAVTKFV